MSHHHHHQQSNNIKVAFFLNLSFTIIEIIGGLWTNSMAILSDALHDLGDSMSLGLSWFLQRYSKKSPDQQFSFGYARFSLLGAVINSVVLFIGSFFILNQTIPRILNPEPVNPQGMILFAIVGIVLNGAAVLKLQSGTSINEKVVSWHLLEDVLGWVVILVASIVLLFVDLPIIDPILSLLITLYVLFNVIKNLKEIMNIFLQGVPKELSIDKIESIISKEIDIVSIHHTHIWSLEGEKNMMSTHVVLEDGVSQDRIIQVKKDIKQVAQDNNIQHVTIEVEFDSEKCPDKECE
jgi:cobalt-zinc-cadmium efflux system protein